MIGNQNTSGMFGLLFYNKYNQGHIVYKYKKQLNKLAAFLFSRNIVINLHEFGNHQYVYPHVRFRPVVQIMVHEQQRQFLV